MRFHYFTRKSHYWLAAGVALPIVVIAGSGLLLQWKKQLAWVQPAEQRGTGREPSLSFERMLEICRGIPEAGIRSWEDVNRIDVRPDRGMLKIWARNNWEVQLDSDTGEVLQVAYRRSDTIEAIHDGSWFHPWLKLGLFFPAGVVLLLLWLSGLYLFWLPFGRRRKNRLLRRLRQQRLS